MHADYTVQETLCTIYALFPEPTTTLFRKKKLKIGFIVLFTHLKLILLQCFQFSVFNKINCIQTDPYLISMKSLGSSAMEISSIFIPKLYSL